MDYVLKRIHPDGVDAALEKADRYRELNHPAEAESICRDVLAIEAANQSALRMLILALTDQFGSAGATSREARELIGHLADEYERVYYTGIVYERETRAYLARKNIVRSAAYDGFRHAMDRRDVGQLRCVAELGKITNDDLDMTG